MQKKLRNIQKNIHKNAPFWMRHPFFFPVSIFLVTLFIGLAMFVSLGGTTQGANDIRYAEIYVDDQKLTVTTRAKTVADVLEKQGIELIEEDIVEPALDAPIEFDDMQINVYRARPIALIDGDRTITTLSAEKSPRLIAAKAGIKLNAEDEIDVLPVEESASLAIEPAQKIEIRRSIEVQLNIYGNLETTRTTSKTVGELIQEKGIKLGLEETVQPTNLETPLSDVELVSINRPGVRTISESRAIPYAIDYVEDDTKEVGQTETEIEGVDGVEAVIFEVILGDNEEVVERKELQTVIVRKPITARVKRGTKPVSLAPTISVASDKGQLMAAAGIAESDFGYVDYIISSESGWRPGAQNSSSGAYGLCQALPASKMASAGGDYLTNPVTQLRWCSGYASGRYGGWQGAYNAWLVQHWW